MVSSESFMEISTRHFVEVPRELCVTDQKQKFLKFTEFEK